VGFAALAVFTYLAATQTDSFLIGASLILLSGTGWLLVFTCGLPYALFRYDLSKALPPDSRERLNPPPTDRPD
jgi:hypothetical protein